MTTEPKKPWGEFAELHAGLCFLALPHHAKLAYLEPSFRRQEFEWHESRIETGDALGVLALINAEECRRRFQIEAADEALGGISASFELIGMHEASAVGLAPARWSEADRGSLGVEAIWDGLRQLALVALRALAWPVEPPRLSCYELLQAASAGRFSG